MTAPDVTTAVERVRRWVGGDLDCYGTGTEAADKFTTDLRTILSELDRLSTALGEALEAGIGLVEWADEFCTTDKAPTYDAIWPMRVAINRARTALQQQEQ